MLLLSRITTTRPPRVGTAMRRLARVLGDDNVARILILKLFPCWMRETSSTPTSPARTPTIMTMYRSTISPPFLRSGFSGPATHLSQFTGPGNRGGIRGAKPAASDPVVAPVIRVAGVPTAEDEQAQPLRATNQGKLMGA